MDKEFNNIGLYNKYNITKTNAELIDETSEYFVLRLDYGGSDRMHIDACRLAMVTYASQIKDHLPVLYTDLMERYGWETIARKIMKDIVYDNGFVDRWHPETDKFYPAKWIIKIKEASKQFFDTHIGYMTIKDIEAISTGSHDENMQVYGRFPEYEHLDRAITEYYDKVLVQSVYSYQINNNQ